VNRFSIALLLLGVGLRTAAFASERSLWIDEAMVALNIVERNPARLFEPLDRNQGAPVGFLLAMKASVELFGPTERALRLPAFLASLVGLFAFGSAAYRLLPRASAHLALALVAVSPSLVSYAAECKQYSFDAAFAALLLALAVPFFQGPANWKIWLAFAGVGAVSVWCSHPAIFVLAGFGLALVAQAIHLRDRSRLLGLLSLGGIWLMSFAAVYSVNLQHLGQNDYLIRYWAGHFAPWPTSRSGIVWYVDHGLAFVNESAGMTPEVKLAEVLMLGTLLWGIIECKRMARGYLGTAIAFSVTLLIALLASSVHLYPFAGRLLLFLVPMACLVWSCGAYRVTRGYGLAWLIAVWPLILSFQEIRQPARTEDLPPLLDCIKKEWREGDRIYVYGGSGDAGAGPAFDFYSPRYNFPPEAVFRGGIHRENPSRYLDEIAALPEGRIWILFSHRHKEEESLILQDFEAVSRFHRSQQGVGASVYIYFKPR